MVYLAQAPAATVGLRVEATTDDIPRPPPPSPPRQDAVCARSEGWLPLAPRDEAAQVVAASVVDAVRAFTCLEGAAGPEAQRAEVEGACIQVTGLAPAP